MKFWYTGDTSKAICECCAKVVTTTFLYKDVPFASGSAVAKGILVAVCVECDSVVAIPAQSTPAIRQAREYASKPVEVVLAAPFIETLDLAAYRIDPNAGVGFRKSLITYFVHRSVNDDARIKQLKDNVATYRDQWSSWSGAPTKRLSMKVAPSVNTEIEELERQSSLNKTTLVKAIVMDIHSELVLPETPPLLSELKRLSVLMNA